MNGWDDLPDVTPEGQALIRAHIYRETRAANERIRRQHLVAVVTSNQERMPRSPRTDEQ
jgi:hypothetical protein